jgi:hypothetical protein
MKPLNLTLPKNHPALALAIVLAVVIGMSPRLSSVRSANEATNNDEANNGATNDGDLEKARAAYGKLPLGFEANRGQSDGAVDFIARGAGYSLFLKPTEAVFVMSRQSGKQSKKSSGHSAEKKAANSPARQSTVLRMKLIGANSKSSSEGAEEQAGKVSYFTGDDESKWQANVPTFGRVNYKQIYAGIDMTYYGNQRQLEYDFVVAPGADSRQIALAFGGAKKVEVEAASGELIVTTSDGGEVRQHKPVVYQEAAGGRKIIEGSYAKTGRKGEIGFRIGEYDRTLPLIIDPTLVYSTYLGGSNFDSGIGIAVDSQGNAYVTGVTASTNFPTKNPFQATSGGGGDAFVTKLNATGDGLVYSTYLGGNSFDQGSSIAVDSSGNAYVTGGTSSTNFPTKNPLQATNRGGDFFDADAFVTKLNATGDALVYSTYLGGSSDDGGSDIAVDSQGNAYITGGTGSSDFPTKNPFQATSGGGGRFSGGAFVTKLNATGDALVYSTFFGASDGNSGIGIAVDTQGNAYITGDTRSTNFPTKNPFQATKGGGESDAFIAKISFGAAAPTRTAFDFDGDGKADVSVFRPSNGYWYLLNSGSGFTGLQFGLSTDKIVPADYDGDGRTDIAVYRDGTWFLQRSRDGFLAISFGDPTDIPMPADFDGDNKSELVVFRPSNGTWYVYNLANNAFNAVQFGTAGDVPVVADYDGDAKAEYAVYRPSEGVWYVQQSTKGFSAVQFGNSTDKPVVGDYDGDGKADFAVYRPSEGNWYQLKSTEGFYAVQFGNSTDLPTPADYDGDGKTDVAVFRPSDGNWYQLRSTQGFYAVQFGATDDKPIPNAFVP